MLLERRTSASCWHCDKSVGFRRGIRLALCNTKRKVRSMNKITFAVVLGIAVVGATVCADEKVTYRGSMGRIQGTKR